MRDAAKDFSATCPSRACLHREIYINDFLQSTFPLFFYTLCSTFIVCNHALNTFKNHLENTLHFFIFLFSYSHFTKNARALRNFVFQLNTQNCLSVLVINLQENCIMSA